MRAARCIRPPLNSGGEIGLPLARAGGRRYGLKTARSRLGAGMIEEPYERDFEAIEAAVMETPRGRWFLAEFAKRNRVAETRVLLDAVSRLEQSLAGHVSSTEAERLRTELARIAEAIDLATAEAATSGSSDETGRERPQTAELLSRLARNAEAAIADIHAAAERVQEIAWTLHERGADAAVCEELDRRAAAIHTACAFQDLTRQRTQKLVAALCLVEDRLQALRSPSDTAAPQPGRCGPAPDASATATAGFAVPPSPPERVEPEPLPAYAPLLSEAPPAGPPSPVPRPGTARRGSGQEAGERAYPRTLAELDGLDIREKLKLFT